MTTRRGWPLRRWIRIAFLVWGVTSTTWVANTMRTRGVDAAFLQSGGGVSVSDRREAIELRPDGTPRAAGLVFLCGAGVAAKAYLPLLRPVAEAGHVTVDHLIKDVGGKVVEKGPLFKVDAAGWSLLFPSVTAYDL